MKIRQALQSTDIDAGLRQIADARLRRSVAEDSDGIRERSQKLVGFVRQGWQVLEPGNAFVYGWHLDAIADHLQAVTDNQITRLIINVPFGLMKSLMVSVFWPAWEWGPGGRPTLRYLSSSYKDTYVKRDSRKMRDLVMSEWYQALWGSTVKLTRVGETSFENDQRGSRDGVAFSSLTGGRGDRVIIDDPHSTETAESDAERETAVRIFRESVQSRINDPVLSAIIGIMQRLHEGDISAVAKELGYVCLMLPMEYEPARLSYTKVRPSWLPEGIKPTKVRLLPRKDLWIPKGSETDPLYELTREDNIRLDLQPVQELYAQDKREVDGQLLFPERFPKETIYGTIDKQGLKTVMGSYAWAGQAQQRPTPRGGGMFKREWFKVIDVMPLVEGRLGVRGWDIAATEDSSAAATCGIKMWLYPDGRIIIEDEVRGQVGPHGVEMLLKNTSDQDNVSFGRLFPISIPQDPGAAGKVVKTSHAALLGGHDVHFSPESGSKEDRARPLSAQAEAGNVYILRGSWNDGYLTEVSGFPRTKLKDRVDASSRAYAYLLSQRILFNDGGGIVAGAYEFGPE